jgi:hypothetical protein
MSMQVSNGQRVKCKSDDTWHSVQPVVEEHMAGANSHVITCHNMA